MKRLSIFLFLAFLCASCSNSNDNPKNPLESSDSTEAPSGYDLHIIDVRADLSVLRNIKPEELAENFQYYPGLPKNVLIGLTYLEAYPNRAETIVELAVGTNVGIPVDDCGIQVFMRHHILNPRALTNTISNEPIAAYVKGGNIVAFRRFGQIDLVMSEITWRVMILCPHKRGKVTPF
jgi:hypothetical protein